MNAELDKIKSGSSAVILCGGKSTRMAQDKAGLLIGKKTFLQQIEKNLKDADEILLSVKDRRDYPEIGARHIEDREADKGPLMGLCSVLEECSYDKVWVMSGTGTGTLSDRWNRCSNPGRQNRKEIRSLCMVSEIYTGDSERTAGIRRFESKAPAGASESVLCSCRRIVGWKP